MTTISFKGITDMTKDYLAGETISSIASKYGVTPRTVKEYVGISPKTRTEIEEKFFKERIERENVLITEIKEKFAEVLLNTIDEVKDLPASDENKSKLITALTKSVENMDKAIRLNRDMSTENINKREQRTTINVAEIIKELKSPEDKKRFLQAQLEDQTKSKKTIDVS